MTNKEAWQLYTEGLSSPQNYLDWSLRFMVSSSLQRRVSYGGDPKYGNHMTLFPNMYIILVGKAGVGKGVSINPTIELLRHHKKKDVTLVGASVSTDDKEKELIAKIDDANAQDAEAATLKLRRGGEKIEPVLFPYAPDATTYEKLVEDMANAGRRINFPYTNGDGSAKLDIYFHCSMYFGLPELASLLRKRTDDVVNFLLGLYDCPLDYEYKTKTQKSDRVRRGCLNILAGTTPEFMETVFNQNLIDQGFSSRVFFIFAPKNRKNVFAPEPLNQQQKDCRLQLLAHIKRLAGLYGEIQVDASTKKFLTEWWDNYENNRHLRSNISPKLDPYYGRKNIHTIKVAMAEHFLESDSLFIPQVRFEEAIEILAKEEKNMHMALTFSSDNPLGKLTDSTLIYIKTKQSASIVDLMVAFNKMCPRGIESMKEVIEHLILVGEIKCSVEVEENTGRTREVYKANI